MVPDIDIQLRVVMKALRDVVAPAIDPENRLAVEQLHLAIATLGMVQAHLPQMQAVARRELANAISLARAARSGRTPALDDTIADGRTALDDPGASTRLLDSCRAALLSEVSALVRSTAEPGQQKTIARAILAASKEQCDLARAWSLPAGFEPDPEDVPALETLLAEPVSPAET